MKKIFLLSCLSLIFSCKSIQTDSSKKKTTNSKNSFLSFKRFTVLETNEINTNQKNKAYELGQRMPTSCNTSKLKRYTTAEATEEIINNITPEKLSKTCKSIHKRNGDFEGMAFMEAIYDKREKSTIYRFKATYEKTAVPKEIRVIMNKDNKISGITSKEWKDKYQ